MLLRAFILLTVLTVMWPTSASAQWMVHRWNIGIYPVRDVHFLTRDEGWAVGTRGTILHTTNGGGVWESQSSGTIMTLWGIHFTSPENGWVVGNRGTIMRTTDGWMMRSAFSFAFILSLSD